MHGVGLEKLTNEMINTETPRHGDSFFEIPPSAKWMEILLNNYLRLDIEKF